jgi:hypothetical protein
MHSSFRPVLAVLALTGTASLGLILRRKKTQNQNQKKNNL